MSRNSHTGAFAPIFIIGSIIAAVCLTAVAVIGVRILGGYGITFYGRYESVKSGMSEEHVVDLLGRRSENSTEFHLGQYQGFEDEYEKAKRSKSQYYLFWNKGIDVVYAIGFDAQHKVTIKAVGGT